MCRSLVHLAYHLNEMAVVVPKYYTMRAQTGNRGITHTCFHGGE